MFLPPSPPPAARLPPAPFPHPSVAVCTHPVLFLLPSNYPRNAQGTKLSSPVTGITLEGEEERNKKLEHRTATGKPTRLENPASVDRLQSLVAGLAGTKQRDLKPYLKQGAAIKPKTLLNPARPRTIEFETEHTLTGPYSSAS